MRFTCELCSGKIVNGRCVDCGMDYSRRKNRYHLNENCDDYDKNAHFLNQSFEKTLITSEEKEKKSASWKKKTVDVGEELKRMQRNLSSAGTTGRSTKTRTGKKKSPLGMIFVVCAGIFIFSGALGALIEDDMDVVTEEYIDEDDDPEVIIIDGEEEDEYSYEDVEFTDGLDCSFTYGQGLYVVGLDLPAGEYTLTNQSELWSSVFIATPDNHRIDDFDFEPKSGEKNVWKNVALVDGMTVRIDMPTDILFTTHNAQIDNDGLEMMDQGLQYYQDEGIVLDVKEKYTVGDDIDPGRYALAYDIDQYSSMFMKIQAPEGEASTQLYLVSFEEIGDEWYYGLELNEGDTISFALTNADLEEVTLYMVCGPLE